MKFGFRYLGLLMHFLYSNPKGAKKCGVEIAPFEHHVGSDAVHHANI
jgi:hypothetical protein